MFEDKTSLLSIGAFFSRLNSVLDVLQHRETCQSFHLQLPDCQGRRKKLLRADF
jgi:hypothetical protein